MTAKEAFLLLENGKARAVCATVLILRTGDECHISFDGKEWEAIDSKLIEKQI